MQAKFCWSLRGLIYHFTLSVRFPIARVDNCTLSQGMYIEKKRKSYHEKYTPASLNEFML